MQPRLLTYRHEEFPAHLNWQAVSFIRIVWPWVEGGRLRETYGAELCPFHFALVLDDLLVSYAATIEMETEHAGDAYRLRGLGNVFTYPSFRGQGYGGQVVDAATRHIRSSDADVAALFCRHELAGFYARRGWQTIERAATFAGAGQLDARESTRMMLFVSAKGRSGRRAFETQPLRLPHGW